VLSSLPRTLHVSAAAAAADGDDAAAAATMATTAQIDTQRFVLGTVQAPLPQASRRCASPCSNNPVRSALCGQACRVRRWLCGRVSTSPCAGCVGKVQVRVCGGCVRRGKGGCAAKAGLGLCLWGIAVLACAACLVSQGPSPSG